MLGFDQDINFKFVRKYAALGEIISKAVQDYINDVKNGNFPSDSESY